MKTIEEAMRESIKYATSTVTLPSEVAKEYKKTVKKFKKNNFKKLIQKKENKK